MRFLDAKLDSCASFVIKLSRPEYLEGQGKDYGGTRTNPTLYDP